jgi:hypothetical protein
MSALATKPDWADSCSCSSSARHSHVPEPVRRRSPKYLGGFVCFALRSIKRHPKRDRDSFDKRRIPPSYGSQKRSKFPQSCSVDNDPRAALARHEHDHALRANVNGEFQKRRGWLRRSSTIEPEDDRIERFSGNECIEVRGYKPRPITLTSHRCASPGEIDGLLSRVDPDH